MGGYTLNYVGCDNPWTGLAASIVVQAYKDLRRARKHGAFIAAGKLQSVDSLVEFFCSSWADTLLEPFGFCGEDILKKEGISYDPDSRRPLDQGR